MKDFLFLFGAWFISLVERDRAWAMLKERAEYLLNTAQRDSWEREQKAKEEFGLMSYQEWNSYNQKTTNRHDL